MQMTTYLVANSITLVLDLIVVALAWVDLIVVALAWVLALASRRRLLVVPNSSDDLWHASRTGSFATATSSETVAASPPGSWSSCYGPSPVSVLSRQRRGTEQTMDDQTDPTKQYDQPCPLFGPMMLT